MHLFYYHVVEEGSVLPHIYCHFIYFVKDLKTQLNRQESLNFTLNLQQLKAVRHVYEGKDVLQNC